MFSPLLPWLLPLAQAAPKAGESTMPPWVIFAIQLAPILLLGYLFFGLPMRQQKRRQEMISGVKKNDKVLTEAGIYGTVVSVDPQADKLVLRIDDDKNVRMTCRKSSVVRVEAAPGEAKEKSGAAS
jgi:preprotein translocase subunit YajC